VLYVIDSQSRALELPARAEKGMRLRELWSTKLTGTFMASPVYRDGFLYTIESQKCRPIIIAASTGAVLTVSRSVTEDGKQETVEQGLKVKDLAAARFVYASPAAFRESVFFFDDGGHTAVLEPGRAGRLVRVNHLDDAIVGTPFFVNDKIIIRGSTSVYCIGVKN
jgi:hypothetical protein